MDNRPPTEVFVSSQACTLMNSPYTSEVMCDLPLPVSAPPGHELYCSLIGISLPHSWMNINSTNNTLAIDGTEYTIPEGNYSAYQLASTLNFTLPVLAVFSPITCKLTLSSGNPFTVSGSLCGPLNIGEDTYGTSISSVSTIDLVPVKSIFVITQFLGDNVDARYGGDPHFVLARIPVNSKPLDVLVYEAINSKAGALVGDIQMNQIRIRLEDEWGNVLQATKNWDMTLQLTSYPSARVKLAIERPLELATRPVSEAQAVNLLGLAQNQNVSGQGAWSSEQVLGQSGRRGSIYWESSPNSTAGGEDGAVIRKQSDRASRSAEDASQPGRAANA